MNVSGLILVMVSASLLLSTSARADRCSALQQQQQRIQDEVTALEVRYPLFTAGLEACAQESKDGTAFAVCALIVCAIGEDTCRSVGARILDLSLQKARADHMAKQAGCGPSPSSTAASIEFTNSCPHPVDIAVMYQTPAGQWVSDGWWPFRSGQHSALRLDDGNLASTTTARMYYHAVTTDGSALEWRGGVRVNLGGRSLAMREVDGSNFELTCAASAD
jgi:uncharacterized membrane protein